jgi:hypothetical protein
VLLRDLDNAYRQLHARGAIQFATEESSYKQWGLAVVTQAESDALQHESSYSHDNYTATLPLDLTSDETAALLNDCTATYHAEINELLLAGVYLGLRQWSGESSVRITLEEHDDEDLFPEMDVMEIVGCFITSHPLLLHHQDGAVAAVIGLVKEQYRAVPRYGTGYGLLGHAANDELLSAAAAIDMGALLFDQQSNQKTVSIFAVAGGQAICLTAEVAARTLRLRLDYDEGRYGKETIAALAHSIEEAFRALIARQNSKEK